MRATLAVLALSAGLISRAVAQGVVVAPHAVYLDHRTRSTAITLYNPGAQPTEVSIGFLYGYPVTDSVGNFTLYEPAQVDSSMPSANGWIEAFPKRVTIPPLTRQTVRLLARPPMGLADGEYWARVVVGAKGGAVPVAGPVDSSQISVGLTLEIRTILPLIYRKGVLQTGVTVSSIRTERKGDSLGVRVHMVRQGTSAYVGTARGSLVDDHGKAVASFSEPVAVYYDADPAFALPLAGVPSGSYKLRLDVTAERPDILPELLLRATPVHDSVMVTVP